MFFTVVSYLSNFAEKEVPSSVKKLSEQSFNEAGKKLYEKACSVTERIEKNNRLNLMLIAVICVVLFGVMQFFNMSTHLAADDYAYNFVFIDDGTNVAGNFVTGERLSSVSDILRSMQAHYNTINGRVVIHFLVQLMMLAGKSVFNVLNSLMFVALIMLMYLHCKGRAKQHNATLFVMLALAVWSFAPGLGVTVFWLDGSVNYLWGSVIRLAVLLPFRFYYDSGKCGKTIPMVFFMAVASFVAGATNENTSAAFVGLCVLFMVLYKLRGQKLPAWGFSSIISAVCGYAFMVFAPATFGRMNDMGGILKLKYIAVMACNSIEVFCPYVAVFIIVALVLYFTGKDKTKLNILLPACYMLAAFAGDAVMLFSPYFPERAWFGMHVAAIVSVGMLVYQLKVSERFVRQCVSVAAVFWAIWGSYSVARTAYDAYIVDSKFDARDAYIEEQIAQGNYDITVRLISPEEKRSPHYGVADLYDNPESRINKDMAKYYGLNSIVKGENNDY